MQARLGRVPRADEAHENKGQCEQCANSSGDNLAPQRVRRGIVVRRFDSLGARQDMRRQTSHLRELAR